MAQNTLVHNHLTVVLPEGWEDASQVIGLGPEDDGFRPNLVFSQEPVRPGEDAAAFARRQLPQLYDALDYYKVIAEGPAEYGMNKGYLRQHTFRIDKGSVGQLQFYVVIAGRAYTLTFTHLVEKFPVARELGELLFSQATLRLTDYPDSGQPDAFDL